LDKIIFWCQPCGTLAYQDRVNAMLPFVDSPNPYTEEDLPVPLQYHINLLVLLSGSKLGQKLEAVYSLEALIDAILDLDTLFIVRRNLGLLLIEFVEMSVEGLESSEPLWLFFSYCSEHFQSINNNLPNFLAKSSSNKRYEDIEWFRICLQVVIKFFSDFDLNTFSDMSIDANVNDAYETTRRTEHDIHELVCEMLNNLKKIRKSHAKLLGKKVMNDIKLAIDTLASTSNTPDAMDDLLMENNMEDNQNRRFSLFAARKSRDMRKQQSSADRIHEEHYRKQYQVFLNDISKSNSFSYVNFGIHLFSQLPLVSDLVAAETLITSNNSDIRLESFIEKVCMDMKNRIVYTSRSKMLDATAVDIAKWFIEIWTSIIENEIGLSVDDIANPECILFVNKPTKFQSIFNDRGVTDLCLDIIAIGMETSFCVQVIRLLIAIMAISGGNVEVQTRIHKFLWEKNSTYFFEQIKDLIDSQITWCQRDASNESNVIPDTVIVLKLIHSMCEGSFAGNKELFREQNKNTRFVNILDSLTAYVSTFARNENHACTKIGIRVMHAILGLVQGPCVANQEYFVLQTNLLTALNRIMRSSQSILNRSTEWSHDQEVLKEYVIDVLRALIEGQHLNSIVVERVQLAMELNVLNVLILPPEVVDETDHAIGFHELSSLQAKYLVFVQSLGSQSVKDIPVYAQQRIQEDIAIIEIIWNNKIIRHVYYLPEFAKDITENTKRKLLDEVEITTQEVKLKDFVKKAKELYQVATHQKLLKSIGLNNIWRLPISLSWLMFFNCIAINVLLISFYKDENFDIYNNVYLPRKVDKFIYSLILLQLLFALCAMLLYILVTLPVSYKCNIDNGLTKMQSLLHSIFNFATYRHIIYFTITVLAIEYSYLLMSILLLDFIILDSTSKDVLYAVIYPFRQLTTSLVIIFIMINVFSGVLFTFFRDELMNNENEYFNVYSMWEMIKIVTSYGLR
jgi:hypothetical protein